MGCRTNGTSIECYGPVHLLDNLSATWERAKISEDIQFIINRVFRNLYIGTRVWEPNVMEIQMVGFEY